MISPTLQHTFDIWLDDALADRIPDSVTAFCFNLAEPWQIEVIGAARYSEDDPDWACDEAFRPKSKNFLLPEFEVGATWDAVLDSAKALVAAYLSRPSAGSDTLIKSSAIAIGFVDGELHKIWP